MSDEEKNPTESDSTEESPPRATTQPDTPEVAAKKLKIHQRAGHRGTVTRLIGDLDDAVYSGNIRRLKHIQRILEEKDRILTTLNEQIAEETEGKKLEAEIQQADIVKENIDLALLTIIDTLENLQISRTQSPIQTFTPLSHNHDDGILSAASTESGNPVSVATTSNQCPSTTASELPTSPKRVRISTTNPTLPGCGDTKQATSRVDASLLSSTVPSPTSTLASENQSTTTYFRTATATFPPFMSTAPQFTSTAPQFTSTAPQFMSTAPQFMSNAPQWSTAPQFMSNAPQLMSTAPRFTSTVPQYTSPFAPVSYPLVSPQFRAGATTLQTSVFSPPHASSSLSFGDYHRPRANVSTTGNRPTSFDPSISFRTATAPFLSPTAPPFIPDWLSGGGQLHSGPEPSSTNSPLSQVRLPKLSIKKYNGDLTKWRSFWDSFKSSIHENPTLSDIDKFSYLTSLVESAAADAIAGLSITAANYEEAISTLKKRFGNEQSIVNKHMDALLSIQAVTSNTDVKSLRRLTDTIEAHVRGLRAMGVTTESYGGILTNVLVNKLPSEIRLIVNRATTSGRWELERVLEILSDEVDARERAASSSSTNPPRNKTPARLPTSFNLLAGTSNRPSNTITCTYCKRNHHSAACTEITDINARKSILRSTGKCYICLRKGHTSRKCTSNITCRKCHGKHHTSICQAEQREPDPPKGPPKEANKPDPPKKNDTSTLYVGSQNPVLLQTAQLNVSNLNQPSNFVTARAVMDSGSQRTYITSRLRDKLRLQTKQKESLSIKTFGSSDCYDTTCDVVEFMLSTKHDGTLPITALVVPLICNPISSHPIVRSMECFDHLSDLELADPTESNENLEVDVLIGSDIYWNIITGRVVRGESGPIAVHSKVGWILSGPVDRHEVSVNLCSSGNSHTLKIDAYPVEMDLERQLSRFWDLESLGVAENEPSVYEKFVQQITFDGSRYQVRLPWRCDHPPLPSNKQLCQARLRNLVSKLKQSPPLLAEYDSIIQEQLKTGIIEEVTQEGQESTDRIHYLPHHSVIREDKESSKLRIVYDASARSKGPSLNDCLYTGPKSGQSIFDILIRFRLQPIALVGDIEKAFLMVSVSPCDRDSLRFLWTKDTTSEPLQTTTYRFARVVFGVSSSPFLLNATIHHHISSYAENDPGFTKKFLSSTYVDDIVSGAEDVDSAYTFYLKSRLRLATAGFRLRKFKTNSPELQTRIQQNELSIEAEGPTESLDNKNSNQEADPESPSEEHSTEGTKHIHVEDQTYAKTVLGTNCVVKGNDQSCKVLGVHWHVTEDMFKFDTITIANEMEKMDPTKRNLISITARFFDPLGIASPITISFKMLCQDLCRAKLNWDEALTGQHLNQWNQLLQMLKIVGSIAVPRCVTTKQVRYSLIGFCDSSAKAYAAVVYLKAEEETHSSAHILTSKTRVAPLGNMTIPRLELLSALLLARLVTAVKTALEVEPFSPEIVCYSDSMATLYWIKGTKHEWKQFIENRVNTIRTLVPPNAWKHCPGTENPADLPSRGINTATLSTLPLWLHGPDWLQHKDCPVVPDGQDDTEAVVPDDCVLEMKLKERSNTLLIADANTFRVSSVISANRYSSIHRLIRVTALVIKFINHLRGRTNAESTSASLLTVAEIHSAHTLWMKDIQVELQSNSRFSHWTSQLGLYLDESGVWRCGGRLSNAEIPTDTKNPIILDKNHYVTELIVADAHHRVLHNGVAETLAELRASYWLVRGRQYIRRHIYRCVTCRKLEGRPYKGNPSPPLPDFRVKQLRPFQATGVDFAGPMLVRSPKSDSQKVWLCLFTCCSTRAVHLELVVDMTVETFIRCLKRFTSRRGIPSKIVSDNGKTFVAANKLIISILKGPAVRDYLQRLSIEWQFNLEKSPWWGGIFERMIRSAKRCLRKAIGKNSLTYDELLTLVVEVEAVLNSRPLTYVSSEDLVEPLTPSHLLTGFRILTIPDPVVVEDDLDFAQTLSRRRSHLSKVLDNFWRRWKREYLLELREFHRTQPERKGIKGPPKVGEIVTIYDEDHPRGIWRIGRIEELIKGADDMVRGVVVKTVSKKGQLKKLRRPIQQIYPLEVRARQDVRAHADTHDTEQDKHPEADLPSSGRPKRDASANSRLITRLILQADDDED